MNGPVSTLPPNPTLTPSFNLRRSASEIGTATSTAAVANQGRERGQAEEVHRAEKRSVGVKRNYPSVEASRRGDGVAGKRTRAGARTGVSRDKEGTDRRRRPSNLLQEVKEASSKGSWQDVLVAMEETKFRGLRLDGRCSDLGGEEREGGGAGVRG